MRVHPLRFLPLFAGLCFAAGNAPAQDALKVVDEGKTRAVVVVDAKAGKWEQQAAADLVNYAERMTGCCRPGENNATVVPYYLRRTLRPILASP